MPAATLAFFSHFVCDAALFGVLPIEHSVSGMIIQTVDFLFTYHKELQIVHELPLGRF